MAPTNDRNGEILHIAGDILAYLSEHPDAQDTLQGIMKWWLLEQTIRYQTTRVKQALAYLVESGFIVEQKSLNLRSSYHMNSSRLDEISAVLRKVRPERRTGKGAEKGSPWG